MNPNARVFVPSARAHFGDMLNIEANEPVVHDGDTGKIRVRFQTMSGRSLHQGLYAGQRTVGSIKTSLGLHLCQPATSIILLASGLTLCKTRNAAVLPDDVVLCDLLPDPVELSVIFTRMCRVSAFIKSRGMLLAIRSQHKKHGIEGADEFFKWDSTLEDVLSNFRSKFATDTWQDRECRANLAWTVIEVIANRFRETQWVDAEMWSMEQDEESYLLKPGKRLERLTQTGDDFQYLGIVFDADDHRDFLVFKSQASMLVYAKEIDLEVVHTLDAWDGFHSWFNNVMAGEVFR